VPRPIDRQRAERGSDDNAPIRPLIVTMSTVPLTAWIDSEQDGEIAVYRAMVDWNFRPLE
jgi:hypothetical protein